MLRLSSILTLKQKGPIVLRMHSSSWQTLLHDKAYVNGKWVGGTGNKTFDVFNPSTGEKITSVPDFDQNDTNGAIEHAHTAFKTWKMTLPKERSDLLRKWYNLCMKNQESLAQLLTIEQGKPLAEARGEIAYGSSFFEWYSEEARRIYGDYVPAPAKNKEMVFIKQPVGVAALITPWNFPNAMITRKVGAALAAGCTCVIKPAEDTPLSALALAQLAEEAGIPAGVVNVVTCSRDNAPIVGDALCESSLVGALSFTGSTAVGKILYRQCASTVKKISLELGGNAPFIVFDSANLDAAISGTMTSKFRNCGQTCVSSNRIFVQEGIHDAFVEKLRQTMTEKLIVGDGMESGVVIGPLMNKKQLDTVESHIADAKSKGARIVMGGKRHPKGQLFYEPTLLTNISPLMKPFKEEIFGPVASIIKFRTEEEVLAMANNTDKGLAAYFYSQDMSQCWRVAKELESGMVGINEGLISCAECAFGGVKSSGIGREGSKYGIDEYTEIKYLCFGGL